MKKEGKVNCNTTIRSFFPIYDIQLIPTYIQAIPIYVFVHYQASHFLLPIRVLIYWETVNKRQIWATWKNIWHHMYGIFFIRVSSMLWLPSTRELTFGFNAPGHCLVHACLLHCMRVWLHNGYTQAYAQIMQHTHMHKAVTGCVEAKKLLSRRRQSNYSCPLNSNFKVFDLKKTTTKLLERKFWHTLVNFQLWSTMTGYVFSVFSDDDQIKMRVLCTLTLVTVSLWVLI